MQRIKVIVSNDSKWYSKIIILFLGVVLILLSLLYSTVSFASTSNEADGNRITIGQSIKTGWYALDSNHNDVSENSYDVDDEEKNGPIVYVSNGKIDVPADSFDIYCLNGNDGKVQVLIASKEDSGYKDAFITSYYVKNSTSEGNLITGTKTFKNSVSLPPLTQDELVRREPSMELLNSSDLVLSTQSSEDVGLSIVWNAQSLALNGSIGFLTNSSAGSNDLLCYMFVNRVLRETFDSSISIGASFDVQKEELTRLGFTRREFTSFDDPNLVPGSILYSTSGGHTEIYAGMFSTTETDAFGNPEVSTSDKDKQPVSIGAKGWDRITSSLTYSLSDPIFNTDQEPGNRAGDQYQPNEMNWWVGEVSGGRADVCMNAGHADNSVLNTWGYYYVPPQSFGRWMESDSSYNFIKFGKKDGEDQNVHFKNLVSSWHQKFNTAKDLSEWVDLHCSIYCNGADYSHLDKILQDVTTFLSLRLRSDNETAFFISGSRPILEIDANYTYDSNTKDLLIEIVRVKPNYAFPNGDPATLSQANKIHLDYIRKVNEIVRLAQQQALNDINKVKFVHDYLITHCTYNHPAAEYSDRTDTYDWSPWNSYGALMLGQPVCSGYAAAAKVLLEKLGIPCQFVAGVGRSPTGGSHSWNRVCVDGHWYNMDVTWDDDSHSEDETYWFCKSDIAFVSQANRNESDYYHGAWYESWYGRACAEECIPSDSLTYDNQKASSWTRYERMPISILFDKGLSGFAGTEVGTEQKMSWDLHVPYIAQYWEPKVKLARKLVTSYNGESDSRVYYLYDHDDSDISVEYTNNVDAGIASVVITGKGAYSGSVTKNFVIDVATLPETCPSLDTIPWSNNENRFSTKKLEDALGYPYSDLSWSIEGDTTNVGTIPVTIKGRGKNVKGTTKTSFKIVPSDIALFAGASVYYIPDQKYTGQAIKPVVSFAPVSIVAGKVLGEKGNYAPSTSRLVTLNKDFTTTYKNNVDIGKAEVVITGMGNCYGSVKRTFNIVKGDSNFKVRLANHSTFEMRSSLNESYMPIARRFTISIVPASKNRFEILSGNDAFSIEPTTGDIKTNKPLAKGTYPVTVKVSNSGNDKYAASSDIVDFKINILDNEPIIDRLYGNNAYDTMEQIVKQDSWTVSSGKRIAVLATSEGYWDALSACGIAGYYEAPIIMVTKDTCPEQSKRLLRKIDPEYFFVIGGESAITDDVVSQAAQCCSKSEEVVYHRCNGNNAAGTSLKVMEAHRGPSIWSSTAFICTDNGYWDALSAAPISYANQMPIILTQNSGRELHPNTITTMKKEGITKVYIVGGTAAVKPAVEKQLRSAGIEVIKRIAGTDAIDTSYKVAELGITELNMTAENVGVATTNGYWDALAGAAYCGSRKSVLVLANGPSSSTVTTFMKNHRGEIIHAHVFGGPSAVSEKTKTAMANSLK